MADILVAGLINYETTLRVEGFPLSYAPVRYPFFGVAGSTSGVGFNVARALARLGDAPRLLALIGDDEPGRLARAALAGDGLADGFVLSALPQTPQSVILYDEAGRRAIHTDLKDIQERAYPADLFVRAAEGCRAAVLCNINFARPLLALARERGMLIATDVHAVGDPADPYNADFMAAADILFMSHEHLPCPPEDWVGRLWERYPAPLVVVGMGGEGALLAVRADGRLERVPARSPRPVRSTVGAGDALFACFVHSYLASGDARAALARAVLYAGWKVGGAGGADGLLTAAQLDELAAGRG